MEIKCGTCKHAGFVSMFDTDIDEYIVNAFADGEEDAPLTCEWEPDKKPHSWLPWQSLPVSVESGKGCPCWEPREIEE